VPMLPDAPVTRIWRVIEGSCEWVRSESSVSPVQRESDEPLKH
jgi:hypothetical protein